jgi:hypothetical protein
VPDQARRRGNADQEHDGSDCKQEAQKPHQQAHYRISVSIPMPQHTIGQIMWREIRGPHCRSSDRATSIPTAAEGFL